MTVSSDQDNSHPQTNSFLFLFPEPNETPSSENGLGRLLKALWEEKFKEPPLTFIGLSAKSPAFDHDQAEICGNDYNCRVYANFTENADTQDTCIVLGSIPYPDKNGEFVLRGNRYIFPLYLRTTNQYEKLKKMLARRKSDSSKDAADTNDSDEPKAHERKTDDLHVVLFHELLEQRLKRRLEWVLGNLQKNSWDGDPQLLGGSLRSWLCGRNSTILHRHIQKYGQWIDRENPLRRVLQRKELSFHGLGGEHPDSARGYHIRDVDDDDIYRICPVVTPQGHKVGLRLSLARRSKINSERKSLVAPDPSEPGDSLSEAAGLIPFIEHDDVSRALMGANMMKQALPLEEPEAPWIQTGWEKELAHLPEITEDHKTDGILSLGKNLLAAYLPWGLETFEDGIVVSESAARALTSKEEKTFWFNQEENGWPEGDYIRQEITKSNLRIPERDKRRLNYEGIITVGSVVKPGDVLVSAVLKRFKDIHKTKLIDVMISGGSIETLLGKAPEEVRDISLRLPHNFRGRVTGIIDLKSGSAPALPVTTARRIGARIQRKKPLKVGDKITSRHGAKGVVVRILPDKDMPYVKTDFSSCVDSDCPVNEPHRHIQVMLNPLGVTGRLNLGQLYETTLAKVAERRNQSFVVEPFANEWSLDHLTETLISEGFSEDGKEQLYTQEQGAEQPLRYRSLVGPQYFLKLEHMAEEKSQVRTAGKPYDYTWRDNQPRAGKRVRGDNILGSGQRVGEMETWALAGHAAWDILDDLLNVKSDDRRLLEKVNDAEYEWNGPRRPQAFANLILVCRSLAFDLRLMRSDEDVTQKFLENSEGEAFDKVLISFAKQEQIEEWGQGGEVTSVELYVDSKKDRVPPLDELYPHPGGLYSREIFDPEKPWKMGLIKLSKPVLHPLMARYKKKESLGDYKLTAIPVLPISFRQERLGLYKDFQDDLNVRYRNVIWRNSGLHKLLGEEETEESKLEKAENGLRYAIRYLFLGGKVSRKSRRGIINILEGKKGLIRGHLAGKRADYSGRAVIVGDPGMPLNEAGLPDALWKKLFPTLDKSEKPLILLNRQPSLHRYSIQAFRASWHQRGDVICLNPFVCRPFNADFDGDTLALHVPRKPAAVKEAEKLLPTLNLLSQANGRMVLGFDKDLAIGAAYVTFSPSIETDEVVPLTSDEELPLNGRDFRETQTWKGIETTVGRLLLRRLFQDFAISNRTMNQDRWMCALGELTSLAARNDPSVMEGFTRGISRLFEDVLRRSGLSLSLKDFQVFSESQKVEESPVLLWLMHETGRYGKDLEDQITKKRPPMRRPGREDVFTEPIQTNLLNGHTEEDYFLSAHGARAGLVDKGLITAASGHLLRDWIYRLQHLYIVQDDCGTSDGLEADEVDERHLLHVRFDVKGQLIQKIEGGLQFRSPWTCHAQDPARHPGICQKCYGNDPATGDLPAIGLPVGILAAQALMERVSQETLKSFHTGGTVQKEKKGLVLVKYLREAYAEKLKNNKIASKKIQEIFEQFPESSRPSLIHFEVILRGYKSGKDTDGFLKRIAKSQAPREVLDIAITKSEDDLYGVIARIVSGRMIDTDRRGQVNG